MPDRRREGDALDPHLEAALTQAYAQRVDVETASRHLWVIHRRGQDVRATNSTTPPTTRRRVLAGAVTALVLLFTGSGVLAQAGDAVPGDALYRVKMGGEQVQQLLAVEPAAAAQLDVALAQERLREAEALADRDPERLVDALDALAFQLSVADSKGATTAELQGIRGGALALVTVFAHADEELTQQVAAFAQRLTPEQDIATLPDEPAVEGQEPAQDADAPVPAPTPDVGAAREREAADMFAARPADEAPSGPQRLESHANRPGLDELTARLPGRSSD